MPRLAINEHAPEGYRAVAKPDAYVQQNLDPVLLDLVKLRASQLNGCAFCIDMHAADLERQGVPTRKIHGVTAWAETSFFDARERAALALTEEITRLAGGVDGAVWAQAAAVLAGGRSTGGRSWWSARPRADRRTGPCASPPHSPAGRHPRHRPTSRRSDWRSAGGACARHR